MVPQTQLYNLINLSSNPPVEETTKKCPFCWEITSSLTQYQYHVGNHQRETALFALLGDEVRLLEWQRRRQRGSVEILEQNVEKLEMRLELARVKALISGKPIPPETSKRQARDASEVMEEKLGGRREDERWEG